MLSASVAQIKAGVPSTNIYNFLKPLQMIHKAEKIVGWLTHSRKRCIQSIILHTFRYERGNQFMLMITYQMQDIHSINIQIW